jgi:transposase-like protein
VPTRYPTEFRWWVLDLLVGGCPVDEVAHDLEIGQSTIDNWRRQHEIDTGQRPGFSGTPRVSVGRSRPAVGEWVWGSRAAGAGGANP